MGRDRERQLEDAIDQAAAHLRKQNPVEAFRVLQPHCSDERHEGQPVRGRPRRQGRHAGHARRGEAG
jgi:hypothetical protein